MTPKEKDKIKIIVQEEDIENRRYLILEPEIVSLILGAIFSILILLKYGYKII